MDPTEENPTPVLSYAEPATYHSNSRTHRLKRRWFLILVQGALLVAMTIIGGGIGSQFFSFHTRYPWETTMEVQTALYSPAGPLRAADRDVVAASQWTDQIARQMNSQLGTAYTTGDISDLAKVSKLQSDTTFTNTFEGENSAGCLALEDAYRDEFDRYNRAAPRKMYASQDSPHLTTMATVLNPLLGIGSGLMIAFAILCYAHIDFRRRAIADTDQEPSAR